jgi:hypothetical protein
VALFHPVLQSKPNYPDLKSSRNLLAVSASRSKLVGEGHSPKWDMELRKARGDRHGGARPYSWRQQQR